MNKALFFICVLFVGCQTKQEKAEKLVKDYLAQKNDVCEYIPVRFDNLYKLKDTNVLINGEPYHVRYDGAYEIEYTYNCGAFLRDTLPRKMIFRIDKDFKKAECCFTGRNDPQGNYLMTFR